MFNITLKQCIYFVAVAEQNGIAQASRVLNISQPAVAQALAKIEHLYGFQLFKRHHARGTELTTQGRAFLVSARALIKQANQTERDAITIASGQSGIIRLGCFHTIAPFYLAEIISGYKRSYPKVIIESTEIRQDEILQQISNSDIDLALTYNMSQMPRHLARTTLSSLRPFILLPDNHILAGRKSIRLTDMANEPFVMFDGPFSRDYFESLLKNQNINPPVALHSTSIESVRSAVANGLGFSISVMKPVSNQTYNGKNIVCIPIQENIAELEIVLIYKEITPPQVQLESFTKFCRQYFSRKS